MSTQEDRAPDAKRLKKSSTEDHPSRSTPLVDVFPRLPENCSSLAIDDEGPVLKEILAPVITEAQFMSKYFKKKAVVIPGPPARFKALIEESLDELRLESLLDATPTEQIHCWMPSIGSSSTTLQSFQVDSTKDALSVHRAGGSLYFRAPDELSSKLISSLTAELGMGHGAFYRGPSEASPNGDIRGEIETFVSRKGHLTDWHFDFMENFTLQLSGTKTWRFKYTNVPNPLRGCTPHFSETNVIEQQLKVHRLTKTDFEFAPPPNATAGDKSKSEGATDSDGEEYVEITLEAGSFMYFPAGMWHRVECSEEGVGDLTGHSCISINLSLFSAPWADTAADAVRQLLWQKDEWRSGMARLSSIAVENNHLTPKHTYGQAHMQRLLESLKSTVASLTVDDMFPKYVSGQLDSRRFQRNAKMKYDDINNEHDGTKATRFRRNPLSVMFDSVMDAASSVSDDDSDDDGTEENTQQNAASLQRFTVHFNFGNEELDSMARVEVFVPQSLHGVTLWLANKLERNVTISAETLATKCAACKAIDVPKLSTLLSLLHRASFLSEAQ